MGALAVYRNPRLLAVFGQGFSSGLPLPLTTTTLTYWLARDGVDKTSIGLFALFGEILKATRTTRVSVVDHAMSLIAFIVCLIAFLLWSAASTSVFFLLMIMTLVDVLAGFTVSLSGARRDIDMGTAQL